jgi:hypothetical protein
LDWINETLLAGILRETVGVGPVIKEEKIALLLIEDDMLLEFIVRKQSFLFKIRKLSVKKLFGEQLIVIRFLIVKEFFTTIKKESIIQ